MSEKEEKSIAKQFIDTNKELDKLAWKKEPEKPPGLIQEDQLKRRKKYLEEMYPTIKEELVCLECKNKSFTGTHYINTKPAIYGEISKLILTCPCGFSKEFILEG